MLLCSIVFICSESRGDDNNKRQITLIFRFDDYSSRSATHMEQRIIDLFAEHRLSLTIGVIPYVCAGFVKDTRPQEVMALSPAKAEILRQAVRAGTVDVALHGYSHQSRHDLAAGKPTEFAGLDYQSQLLKLREGKTLLEKLLAVPIDTFIPPWSTYDANTLLALEKLNFQCISATLSGYDSPSATLKFLPATCELLELRQVLTYAQRIAAYYPTVCAVFHEYDFREAYYEADGGKGQMRFQDFEDLIAWVASQKNIRVRTMDQVIKENVDLSVTRFINNKYYLRLAHLKPAFWPPHYGVYAPSDTAFDIRMRNIFKNINVNRIKNILAVASFYLIIFIITAIISFLIGLLIFRIIPVSILLYSLIKYGCAAMSLLLVIYLIFFARIIYTALIPMVALLGTFMGLWISFPKKKIKAISVR